MTPVLLTEELSKRYGERMAVSELDLRVERGDVFGFLGENGAGKSTTLRMVLGLVRPTRGRVLLLGEDLRRRPLRALRRVGAIVEAPAFHERLSGWRNLALLAALSGGAPRHRIAAALELVGLADRADEPVGHYSHGMRQRLGIAQALLPDPELVILDEPTDGLDPRGIREMRALVLRLREELGITVVLCSHLLHEVQQLCTRVAILHQGRLLHQGDTARLVDGDRVRLVVDRADDAMAMLARDDSLAARRAGPDALLLRADADRVAKINAALVERGIAVREIAPVRETLEEVFLRLTGGA